MRKPFSNIRRLPNAKNNSGDLRDFFPAIRGEFHLTVLEKQGDGSTKVVEEYSDKNLIVAKAPFILANCLSGDSSYAIDGVQWGTGGHVSGDENTPIPPDVSDLSLEELILETAITGTSIGETYIQFETEMASGDGNGNTFTEAGLVIADASKLMFARKTFPGIAKTADRVLSIRWIISFIQSSTGSDCQGVGLFGQLSPIRQWRYTVPASPTSYTSISVPLTWPAGLNRLFVYRNGKRLFNGEGYSEDYPSGIIDINPAMVENEVFTFEVIE